MSCRLEIWTIAQNRMTVNENVKKEKKKDDRKMKKMKKDENKK